MKNLFLLTFLWINVVAFAQDQLTIKLKNTKGQPLPNVEVTANNTEEGIVVSGRTDASGKVTLTLTEVGVYSLSYLEEKDFETYEVMEGMRGMFSRTVTYDPEKVFAEKPKGDRSSVQFSTIAGIELKGKEGVMKLNVKVSDTKSQIVPGVEVIVVSVVDKLKFKGKSDSRGFASFYVPANKHYEIDVDGNEALKIIDLPNMPGGEMTHVVFYEKLKVTEITKGDTIVQRNITQTNGTNTHLLFTLKLLNYEGVPLEGESVYLQAEGSPRVYEGITGKDGSCSLMIQKNANYILNLKYEQGLHLVEAKEQRGFGMESLTRRYRGSEEIERMLAEQEAEMKRLLAEEQAERERLELKKKGEKAFVQSFYDKKFVPSFRETPIENASVPTGYLSSNATGYTLSFKSSGPIGTPTVINNQMFIPAGFYSPDFYCLNATTGAFVWGVELGESGASPAVYHNGVILINTYSCTLYALDAQTGQLLWSKWLAGTVYSTPTADGDKVYVVYRYGGEYVLSCFDLRSGTFKWINHVDSETIACPVVEGSEVHVASQSGFYYIFDKTTGKPIDVLTDFKPMSSPTLTPEGIFLTANMDGKDQLIELDRTTHTLKKKYGSELKAVNIMSHHDCSSQMNFTGTHPIVYKNEYVVVADEGRLVVFDMKTEQVKWQKQVQISSSQIPIVANGRVILASNDGTVMSYDIATGLAKVLKKHSSGIDAQPVHDKGILYLVSGGILTAIKSVQDFKWNQWNKDPSHNLYER